MNVQFIYLFIKMLVVVKTIFILTTLINPIMIVDYIFWTKLNVFVSYLNRNFNLFCVVCDRNNFQIHNCNKTLNGLRFCCIKTNFQLNFLIPNLISFYLLRNKKNLHIEKYDKTYNGWGTFSFFLIGFVEELLNINFDFILFSWWLKRFPC